MKSIGKCLAKNKSSLFSKQKTLTKKLEGILVSFVDSNHKEFEVGVLFDLPVYVKGLIRLHASNILWMIKCEMCNNVSEGRNCF